MLQLLAGAQESSRDVPDRTIIINEPQRQSLKDPEDVIRPRQVREARGVGTFGAGVKLEPKYLKQCSSCKRLVKTKTTITMICKDLLLRRNGSMRMWRTNSSVLLWSFTFHGAISTMKLYF